MLRASNDAYGHMIMLMGVRIEAAFDRAQTHHPAQLSTDQRHHVTPALERLVVGVAVILLHNPTKLPPIDRLEEISKDAIRISHARPLFESRQPESTRFAPDWSGMLRGIVNHSPDGPARDETSPMPVIHVSRRSTGNCDISAIHRRDRGFAIFPGGSPTVHGYGASHDRALPVSPTSSR